MKHIITLAIAATLALSGCQANGAVPGKYFEAPVPERVAEEPSSEQVAILAGGCFWCVEAVFSHTKGIKAVVSGYHGGSAATATYDDSNTGVTGHAEAVRIVYDPAVIRYDQILQIFFSVVADPTVRNRQGPDVGPQYRAALIPINEEQTNVAGAYLAQMEASGAWPKPIVTEIEKHRKFYPAEDYHQDFVALNPRHPYVLAWSVPKVDALKKYFPQFYRDTFLQDHKS